MLHRISVFRGFCGLMRFISACVLLLSAAGAHAASPLHVVLTASLPDPPVLRARSAILIEARTGAVLFEDHADEQIPPASLAKLMTLHIALDLVETGRLDPSRRVVPGSDAWARNMPPRSSLMYLGPNQVVTVHQLLQGLVVDSGNDAAVELADQIAGSVGGFAALMNREAARLGYSAMRFVEPAGISAENRITAREYVDFCRHFVAAHPDALRDLFSLRELTYPLPENLTNGNNEKPITQANRNVLLGKYEGIDGLKTGYIDEAGYNIAATAERGDMRLIAVVLGVPDVGRVSGAVLRNTESEALLDYGFANFVVLRPDHNEPLPVRVWKGGQRSVLLGPTSDPLVVVPRSKEQGIHTRIEQEREVIAPVRAGQVLGHIVVQLDGAELTRFPLAAKTDVPVGGILRRAMDSVILLFHKN
ncbi:MAG: D-alanyl-D-alanine carboxypeptidase family protein [Spirochaetia bacterium]|jgi:D-alanyl-D-alanine carboxypeptidase (penicillin-binding protein 5/6)